MITDRYVRKNKKYYFEKNKNAYKKLQKKGGEIVSAYGVYSSYLHDLGLNKVVSCSSSVVANSRLNPTKYVLKYSNIEQVMDDVEKLDYISEFMSKREIFIKEMQNVSMQISTKLPAFYRYFVDKNKLAYVVCDIDFNITSIRRPFLYFRYVSPAGRSCSENRIVLDTFSVQQIIGEISKFLDKNGHIKMQRGIMSNDLREAIKLRDNYTCCNCGNSIYDEPNLLLEVDHIIPISKGGKTEASNLQTLCWRCNRTKSNKTNNE